MTIRRISQILLVVGLLFLGQISYAQFSGAVTGTVLDPTGAVVPNAHLTLRNAATGAQRTAVSSSEGVYQFLSLAPGSYELSTTMTGFSSSKVSITLETNQNLNVPVNLALGGGSQTVNVTSQAPLLDSADTRLQETLSTQTLSQLPLAGRSMISLVTLAPGVTGTGVTSNGSPGSGRDNFSTETQVDASANGQGAVGNMYIVDGLDVTSSIRAGVLNLTPNPDSIQETSIQTNTYNVEYGRSSSIQMTMTTKSGGSSYHGNASDYFTYQKWQAGTEFSHTYAPFHINNISATIGGPIIPKHDAGFFFFAIEPLRSSAGVTGQVTFEDPAFVAFANQNFPNSLGTKLMNTYPVSNVSGVRATGTASTVFPGTCGTSATFNLPCSTPMIDTANWSDSQYRNGLQYSIRLDKTLGKDRLYGSYLRNTLKSNSANLRTAFNTESQYYSWGIQINETHTFSPNMLNEAAFAADRVEGIAPQTGLFSVPVVNVTGIGNGFGAGFATGDFIQQNYHWRDVLTYVLRSHVIHAGFEGLFATDVEVFDGPYDQPTFAFNSLLDLARDAPNTETMLAYNPVSGQRSIHHGWDAAGITHGAFVEDTWKINQRLTLNYGVRWDDFGNPYQRTPTTQFANFFYGPGATAQEQIANGFVVSHHHALNRSITDIFSPRAGVAWDVTGNGKWLIKGGAGIFHNWPTLANLQEEYRGNPPGDIFPTFFAGGTPSPIFALGTSNTKPFGFPAPALPAQPLNAQGGLTGTQFPIGGIDANLRSPISYVYSASLDRELGRRFVGTLAYSGAKGVLLLSGGGQVYNVSYGQDINAFNNDLVQNGSISPTRLNHSFGPVNYTSNNRESNYNAFIAALRGRFNHAFFNVSYTHSVSKDDTQVYPSEYDPHMFYGPSNWDAPDRFSLAWNYEIPGLNEGKGLVGRVTGGWQLSGTTIIQSGNPINVYNSAAFQPLLDSNGQPLKNPNGSFVGAASGSGDYNADGDTGTNLDIPNVTTYNYKTTRKDYLNGIFTAGQFTTPALGTEGNEKFNSFRGPYFQQWDMALLKSTQIAGPVAFQFRFEFFNIFNHPNLTNVVTDISNTGSFGKATGQATPRFFQIGGNLTF